ncbi:MAG: ABC transporter substrate-binding protein [Candidatus Acetothermia bacterium]
MKRITILGLVLALTLGFSLVGFSQGGPDTLVIGTTDRVTQLSPANSYDHYSWHVMRLMSDSLLKIKPKSTEVGPALAKDWEVGPEAQEYTFYLREDVTFTNGDQLTAEDVKWSFERAMDLDGPEGGVFLLGDPIDTIEVVDDYTLKITLEEPNATFLTRVTGQVGPALVWNKNGTPADEFAKGELVGVGPYKLSSYDPNESVVYEAYEDYYGGAPEMETVVELKYSNSTGLRTALEAGDIDVAFRTMNPVDIEELEESSDFETQYTENSPSIRYMLFNVTNEVYKDERVRRAMTYAVNREKIADQVFSGLADPVYTMVPRGWQGRLATFPEQDLDKAEELLESAGYTADDPLETTLWFTPSHYGSTEADVAAVIQGSLDQLDNLEVESKSLEWGAYTERQSEGGFGMFLLGWYPDYLEASNFLEPWTTGSPEGLGTFFNNHPNYDAYRKILNTAKALPDWDRRAPLYEAVQELSAQDVPFIPLWANLAQAYVAYKPNVEDIFVDATMDIRVAGIKKK